AIGVVFDPIGTEADLLTDGFSGAVGSIDVLNALGHLQLPRVAQQGIHAGWRHRASGDLHSWAGDFAGSDCLFYVDVGVHGAFSLEIANCGESILQADRSVASGQDRAVWNRLLEELGVVIFGGDVTVEEDVSVRVYQAWEHGGLGEVDGFEARRDR